MMTAALWFQYSFVYSFTFTPSCVSHFYISKSGQDALWTTCIVFIFLNFTFSELFFIQFKIFLNLFVSYFQLLFVQRVM